MLVGLLIDLSVKFRLPNLLLVASATLIPRRETIGDSLALRQPVKAWGAAMTDLIRLIVRR